MLAAGLLVASCSSGDDAAERSPATSVPASTEAAGTGAAATTVPASGDTTADTTATPGTEGNPVPAGTGWTVLVYSIADTDLEPFLLQDVGEMGSVGSGPNLNIVAFVDRATDYSSDGVLGLPDWTGGKLLHVTKGGAEVMADTGAINTGDPAVLADFIATGIRAYPAAHYSLIISDHGASWPGVGGDESAGSDGLNLGELNDGIAAGLKNVGLDKLDLLGFDACLMATYEVASTLAPLAHRMVASQELEPGHGWNYGVLQMLEDDPTTTADGLGAALVDGFQAQAKEQGTANEITLGLIDLDQMANVDEKMQAFTAAITDRAAPLAPKIGADLPKTLAFGRSPDPTESTHMVDLAILASEIGIDALDVSDEADALVRAINDAVLHTVAGTAMKGATGLSIYFPPQREYANGDYRSVTNPSNWAGFLDAYYSAGDAIPQAEQPQFTTDDAETSFGSDGLTISGTFDLAAEDNLAAAYIDYGVATDDGTVTFIGSEPAAIVGDGSGRATGTYDLTALTISDGTETTYAYLDLTFDDEGTVAYIDVPMAYYAPGETQNYKDVLLSLSYDTSTGDILSETYYVYDEELDTYGELTADPDGTIVPEVDEVAADGTETWVPTSDAGLRAQLDSLTYDFEALPSGTKLYVELSVEDYGGNDDYVSATVTIP